MRSRSQIADHVPVVIPSEATDLGCSRSRRKPGFLVAFSPRNDKGVVCQQSFRCAALILGAVLSLAISLATRYSTVVRNTAPATTTVRSLHLDAERQRLLNDGLHWSAPATTFVLFEPSGVSAAVSPAVPPAIRPYSEDLLYSRPPPYF
jgi:hypothetical protein